MPTSTRSTIRQVQSTKGTATRDIMFCERINDGIERDPQQFFKRANSKSPEREAQKGDIPRPPESESRPCCATFPLG
ncbi:hypothetical protein LQR06_00825 (plasmid) [Escherichia coli]|nr:hypothetical protein LQR06_00825 [Escherichia coli]